MSQQKPDVPTLINRILKECNLPESEDQNSYKLNRHQLLELLFYVEELKKTNTSLYNKLKHIEKST